LHGIWLDANQEVDDLQEAIADMLRESPVPNAEEHEIQDTDDFGELTIHPYEGLDRICAWAKFIVAHGKLGAAVINYCRGDIEDATTLMKDCYHGAYDNEADFVQDFLEQTGETMTIPEKLRSYIDYEKMARDWFRSDFFSLDVDGVHVFSKQ